ncbi:MAG: type I restriction enzyme HsdR N-terminal domain-containing protein [Candidatus Dadabacteria bacterium]|nr:type I restriction enzyme HsdR N-terminal domain-containing protein [Candidatus Dadabacteria bacterium]
MTGQLFTNYFLTDGIKETAEWKSEPEGFATFKKDVEDLYLKFSKSTKPNEAATEQEFIRPVLELLGWTDYLPQQGTKRNEDIPDHLLFENEDKKQKALAKTKGQYNHTLAIQESKRFGLPLDKRDGNTTPHGQIQRYLTTADISTDGRIRFGILTNGEVWRLYDHRARPRAEGYYEANIRNILEDEDGLKTFFLIFRRNSFILREGETAAFIETAISEGRRYEERVSKDLSSVVFERVFPNLVGGIFRESKESDLQEIRDAALIFLYRLLFVLYAEDRELLPVNDEAYDDYGMRKRVRDDIASRMKSGDTFSKKATNYYDHLMSLFKIIDGGDNSIGLPPYNGGLFAYKEDKILENVRLSDADIAPIIYNLSHAGEERNFVNYRDMSVQQLGSIYERLLEYVPTVDGNGDVSIVLSAYARKKTGSFYTHQELVDLIIGKTVGPLVQERLSVFEKKAKELKSSRSPKAQRLKELRKFDPANAVLDLKVLDPSMGSGHFLVTAVDFLSDKIAELADYAPMLTGWADGNYVSPLTERIETIRKEIIKRASKAGWILDERKLTDETIIRRMVLKRCIYGVDKNPLTVELAKVSLWLHSFTVGAPLSFLDHHLRSGDSLLGFRVKDGTDELKQFGGGMFYGSVISGAESATEGMRQIEEISDSDVSEVHQSETLFNEVENTTSDLRGFLDLFCGLRLLTTGMKKKERISFTYPFRYIYEQTATGFKVFSKGPDTKVEEKLRKGKTWGEFTRLWKQLKEIANDEKLLHWEVTFPGVWTNWLSPDPEGGFDAIIGNPPWDRIKIEEVEWFADRNPEIALKQTASERKRAIKKLRDGRDPMAAEFDLAKTRADKHGQFFRESGHYPLLSGGDINIYSLFVERVMTLVKPDGLIGLLTPSGIYGDKTAASFFKLVSTTGRVGGLYDFENKKIFFKDIHSSFKFCALIFGGEKRKFKKTDCAFFLHDTKTINDSNRCFNLTPGDFALVNPNTVTAPVFRTRKDAELTLNIYKQHPVLATQISKNAWPVKYTTMFHMTNDSNLFKTAEQLEKKGYYRVKGNNNFIKGSNVCLPLYEGKMVQAFDHRAARVNVNLGNVRRPAQPENITPEEHEDPDHFPNPQFWVAENSVEWANPEWAVAFKSITAPTNIRTMIACIVPRAGFGNSLPLFLPAGESKSEIDAYKNSFLLMANFNSFALDFVTRQKVQGQNLNLFVVEQLPVITPDKYGRRFGKATAYEIVRQHVLQLTYTANDMTSFANDMGYKGEPFVWDEDERLHLRSRLDALYFHLYGISKEDAGYILGTFPIVRKNDEDKFGRYMTRDLILGYMDALTAGDTESVINP